MIDKWTNLVVKRAWVKSRTSKKELTGYQSIVHVSKTHRITCCVGLKHMFLWIVWLQIQKPQSISRGYRLRVFIWNKPKIVSFFGGSVVKNLPVNEGDTGLVPGPERLPGTLEKEMATLSSILAWEIPWIEAPGGLQSMGLQKSQTWLSN